MLWLPDEEEAKKVFEYLNEMEELGEIRRGCSGRLLACAGERIGWIPMHETGKAPVLREMKYLDVYRNAEAVRKYAQD